MLEKDHVTVGVVVALLLVGVVMIMLLGILVTALREGSRTMSGESDSENDDEPGYS